MLVRGQGQEGALAPNYAVPRKDLRMRWREVLLTYLSEIDFALQTHAEQGALLEGSAGFSTRHSHHTHHPTNTRMQ